MAWSDAARAAALATRKAHAHGRVQRAQRAVSTYKPVTAARHAIARKGESHVRALLGATRKSGVGGQSAVDLAMKRSGKLHGVEVKTLVDNKNNKITMHPSSRQRKLSWARSHRAVLHTVVVDVRQHARQVFYHKGVGSFRLGGLTPVSSGAHLRRLMGV